MRFYPLYGIQLISGTFQVVYFRLASQAQNIYSYLDNKQFYLSQIEHLNAKDENNFLEIKLCA